MTEADDIKCPFCRGGGKETTTLNSPKGHQAPIELPDCKECGGTGVRKPE